MNFLSAVDRAGVCASLLLVVGASAGWRVINLHPVGVGATSSRVHAIFGSAQVGEAQIDGIVHAGLWSGTGSSWVDLHTPGDNWSYGWGAGAGMQVGTAQPFFARASIWTGSAASRVDLHPLAHPYVTSNCLGTSGSQQVGYADFEAALWNGSAASWVGLHPAGAASSRANATSGSQQVGEASFGGQTHAALWTGTASSFVDLNPAGSTNSTAKAVSGGRQAGHAMFANVFHAGLWTGTQASWTDLHPPLAESSRLFGMFADRQVGDVTISTKAHAGLWRGTAASWVDLHAFVPEDFQETFAEGIWSDGSYTYVVGWGTSTARGRDEALMWVNCPADLNDDGLVDDWDFVIFARAYDMLDCADPAMPAGCPADLNHDGIVEDSDFVIFVTAYNELLCP